MHDVEIHFTNGEKLTIRNVSDAGIKSIDQVGCYYYAVVGKYSQFFPHHNINAFLTTSRDQDLDGRTTGELIRAARKKNGLSQAELADELGIPYQSIGQWENDLRNPKIETLQKIADALDVDVSNLIPD